MKLTPQQQAELRDLVDAVCEDGLAGPAAGQLESLLLANDDACSYYLDYFSLHGSLMLAAAGEDVKYQRPEIGGRRSEVGDRDSGFGNRNFHVPNLQISKSTNQQNVPLSAFAVGGPVFSYIAATLILGVMLMGAWAYKITRDYSTSYVNNSRGLTAPGEPAQRPELIFVARVTGMKDCRWADPQTETYAGAAVSLGRKYALSSGLMEITYRSGAKVILEGPCSYEVESAAGGFLALGKLTAKVEKRSEVGGRRSEPGGLAASAASVQPQASITPDPRPKTQDLSPKTEIPKSPNLQISKFTVRTPTAIVTDLGTEFGVEVAANGDTISHVFQGRVVVRAGSRNSGKRPATAVAGVEANREIQLSAGETVRVENRADGAPLVERAAAGVAPKFARGLPAATERTQTIAGNVFQDDFDDDAPDAGKWTATATLGGSVSLAGGRATIRSGDGVPDGLACLHSAALDFGESPDDWWVEIKFKLDGQLVSGFTTVRDWIVLAGVSAVFGDWKTQGFDLRAMQRGEPDGDSFDLGWRGWDNVNDGQIPVSLARGLEKGRFYTIQIHRKSDATADVFLDGRLIAVRPLIAAENPALLHCGDVSQLVGGTQIIEYVKVGAAASVKTEPNHERRKEDRPMSH